MSNRDPLTPETAHLFGPARDRLALTNVEVARLTRPEREARVAELVSEACDDRVLWLAGGAR